MTEAEQTLRRWNEFQRAWKLMWIAFNREEPKKAVKEDVWEQCQFIPHDAWKYILDRVRDEDRPPANPAKKMKLFYYQWSQAQGEAQASFKPKQWGGEGPVGRKLRELIESQPHLDPVKRVGMAIEAAHAESPCVGNTR
jgi:hypothetical protein